MSDTVIQVNGLYKEYRLGVIGQGTLYRDLQSWWAKVRGKEDPNSKIDFVGSAKPKNGNGRFWALRDVSFEVKQGDVLGIIGRNGAGKSTLLKIISRVTGPTKGMIKIKGRVASLLEVGTGFHPELTGRENVYLNGAILGMTKMEITRKFDEIVAFAEIEKFIDTPVKRYSSGMYVRLAFAVAAHLEPEILIVDEVLAVGDLQFQKKCLGKMEQVSSEGRTVLFVSHNMGAITRLCQRAILLNEGRVICDGLTKEVVNTYLQSGLGTTAKRIWTDITKAPGNNIVCLRSVYAKTINGDVTDSFDIRNPIGIEIEYEVLKEGHVLVPNYHVFNEEGVCVFVTSDSQSPYYKNPRSIGCYTSTAWIPGNFLSEGTLIVGVAISTMNPVIVHFFERDAIAFQVVDNIDGNSARGEYTGEIPGVVRPLLNWETKYIKRDSEVVL